MASCSVNEWPAPIPAARRPPQRLSRVASSWASTTGCRRSLLSTSGHSRTRSVERAMAARDVRMPGCAPRWSPIWTTSKPRASAIWADRTTSAGSALVAWKAKRNGLTDRRYPPAWSIRKCAAVYPPGPGCICRCCNPGLAAHPSANVFSERSSTGLGSLLLPESQALSNASPQYRAPRPGCHCDFSRYCWTRSTSGMIVGGWASSMPSSSMTGPR